MNRVLMIIKRLIRGAKYSEKYGHHPGWPWLFILTIMGFMAGNLRGDTYSIVKGFLGALIMLIIFGSLFLIGCWDRGKNE